MSAQSAKARVSATLIAKCSKCKVKRQLTVCEVCDEAKCHNCAEEHLTEAQERWNAVEESITEINNRRAKYRTQNKKSLESLAVSLAQVNKTYETMLSKLEKSHDEVIKQIKGLEKIYQQKIERSATEWESIETNEQERHHLLSSDPTDLEIIIERIQFYFREVSNEDEHNGEQFKFKSNDLRLLSVGTINVIPSTTTDYAAAPRRLKASVREQYSEIEERIARVTDSQRKNEDLLHALNDPLATRETRMEVVAWIAVCFFNCRIFGGFVRDWIVGGYSAKPTVDKDPSTWITYSDDYEQEFGTQKVPHLNKELVPNDIDCYLTEKDFNIDHFLKHLRRYDIECKVACEIWRGYVLLIDEHRSPFTMDLILSRSALKFHKYRILDVDVNNLFVEKDYSRELGMRTDLIRNKPLNSLNLEAIVENIKNKRFTVLRDYDIEDRIDKLTKRGWTQIQLENECNDDSDEET